MSRATTLAVVAACAVLAIAPRVTRAAPAARADSATAGAASVGSTPARTIAGTWMAELQGGMLHFVLHVSSAADGRLEGKLDSPDQGAMGLALDRFRLQGDVLTFDLTMAHASFEGRVNEARTEIVGEWKQGGMALPLTFRPSLAPAEARRPQEPKKPYPYQEHEVTFDNRAAGVTLAGTLTLPQGKGPFPAVFLISGSGPEDRNEAVFGHQPFLVLADRLTRAGLAVLRADDRGFGKSTGDFAAATSEDFASDTRAALDYLKSRPEIRTSAIGLIGHSEGGLIAPMVASRSRDVAFIVLLAAPGVRGDSLLLAQGEALRRAAHVPEPENVRVLERRLYAVLVEEPDSARAASRLRPMFAEILASPNGGAPDSAAIDAQLRTVLSPWFRFFVKYDPRLALARVTCPVLALNGEKDLQVPADLNLPAIEKALRGGGNRDVQATALPGLNHLFQTCETGLPSEYAKIDETMAPAALDTISRWIGKRTGAGR